MHVSPEEYDRELGETGGGPARDAIESIFRERYRRDLTLHEELHHWAEKLTGKVGALRGRESEAKWKFIRLKRSTTLATPALIQERPVASEKSGVTPSESSSSVAPPEKVVLDPSEILDPKEMTTIADKLDESAYFDPPTEEDARKRVLREIVQRGGQHRFREQLLVAYRNRCAVTGCSLVPVLEAAHIQRYLGEHTNSVTNGRLLRADIHTLFDLNLLGINPDDLTVSVAEFVHGTSYEKFDGRPLRLPHDDSMKPSIESLRIRWEEYWANSGER